MREHAGSMACPVDGATLVMSERQGVEIDYCPQCRGVWLDRGELDKIIERGSVAASAPLPNNPPVREQPGYAQPQGYPQQQAYPPRHGYSKHGHPKRKKSFLEELFD